MRIAEIIDGCCPRLAEAPLQEAEADALAVAFKVLGDPARLRLLSLVATSANAEACVCQLIEPMGLSQPTVSHHLKVLNAAGFLARDKRGPWVYYRLVPDRLAALRDALVAPATDGAQALPA